jgi:hypothetical protein
MQPGDRRFPGQIDDPGRPEILGGHCVEHSARARRDPRPVHRRGRTPGIEIVADLGPQHLGEQELLVDVGSVPARTEVAAQDQPWAAGVVLGPVTVGKAPYEIRRSGAAATGRVVVEARTRWSPADPC